MTFSRTDMLRNRRSVWNVRAMPSCGDLVRLEADDAALAEQDLAFVGLVDARDQVEERRLAGAVRADHADDLALGDRRSSPDTTFRPPNASETPRSSSSVRPSDDLHAALAEEAVRAHDHERDQHDAEHDVARRVRLGEQDVLPHERAEVERRHEQDVAQPSRAAA